MSSKTKQKVFMILFLLGVVLITGFIILFSALPKKNIQNLWNEQHSGGDIYGNTGWEFIEVRSPYQIVLTTKSLNYQMYTLIVNNGIYGVNEEEEGDQTFDAYVYTLKRNSFFSPKWDIKEVSTNLVSEKSFVEVVELARLVDISTLAEDDNDITSYKPRTEEQKKRDEEFYEESKRLSQREDMRFSDLLLIEFEERALEIVFTDDQQAKNILYAEMVEFANIQEEFSQEVKKEQLQFYKEELGIN